MIDLGARTRSVPPPQQVRAPQPPGLGYDPEWYVVRDDGKEQAALSVLQQPGVPVVLYAAPMSGKSTMLRRLMHKLREEKLPGGGENLVLSVDCGTIPEALLDDPAACLRELGVLVIDEYVKVLGDGAPPDAGAWMDAVWRRPGPPDQRLTTLLDQHILSSGPARFVLALDRFDRLLGRGAAVPVTRTFRRWLELREEAPRCSRWWTGTLIFHG
jgi:AAA-like domain